jgi:malonyl-CoA O-methyltransferase
MSDPEFTRPPFDARAAQRWQQVLARQTEQGVAPWLHEEIGRRMAERLEWIKRSPVRWINWRASASGEAVHRAVASRYPESKVFFAPALAKSELHAMDWIAKKSLVGRWLGRLSGAAPTSAEVPEPGQVDLLWANMSLHSEPDPQACIEQWHRLLAVDGMLMFSCLGPDTALEIRGMHAAQGWGPAAHPLTDMHDWGDLLVASGFAEPVMDMERVVLSFASAERALAELRGLGRNLHPDRFAGLRARRWHAALLTQLEQSKNAQGEILLTFEVIYGHAVKLLRPAAVSSESAIALDDMRLMLKRSRSAPRP